MAPDDLLDLENADLVSALVADALQGGDLTDRVRRPGAISHTAHRAPAPRSTLRRALGDPTTHRLR